MPQSTSEQNTPEQSTAKPNTRRFNTSSDYATRPTRFTLFLREFIPWQIVRFIVINAKIILMTRQNEKLH